MSTTFENIYANVSNFKMAFVMWNAADIPKQYMASYVFVIRNRRSLKDRIFNNELLKNENGLQYMLVDGGGFGFVHDDVSWEHFVIDVVHH